MKITMIAALITAGSLALASTAMAGDLSNEKFKSNSSTSKQESQTKCIATTSGGDRSQETTSSDNGLNAIDTTYHPPLPPNVPRN